MTITNTARCADCGRLWPDRDNHSCHHRTARQLRLRDLCDQIAVDDGINTFHWKCIFNDGFDCEYEYLNDDATIFQVTLERHCNADVETYDITVKRNLRDAEGSPTREWFIESTSTMVAAS